MKVKQLVLFLFISTFPLLSQELEPPVLLEALTPEYPRSLKEAGLEGEVELLLLIDEKGAVESSKISNSLNPTLDSLAIATSLKLEFTPAHIGDTSVAVELPYLFHFSLDEDLDNITRRITIKGVVNRRGSRGAIEDAEVRYVSREKSLGGLPTNRVLETLGGRDGQWYDKGDLVTNTNLDGKFTFKGVPSGDFELIIRSDEAKPYSLTSSLKGLKALSITAILEPLPYNSYEVVTRYKNSTEVTERELNIDELGSVAGSSGDPVLAIKSMPGVARTSNGNELILRGARPEDTRYYFDNIEIPYLFHYGNAKSMIPSEVLSSIQLYPSAYGSYYGNGIGGVVSASSDKVQRKQLSGMGEISFMDMAFFLSGKTGKKTHLTGGGRVSDRTGGVEKYVSSVEGGNGVVPTYLDFFGKITFTPFKKHVFTAFFLGARDSLVSLEKKPGNPIDSRSFKRVSFSWHWNIADNLTQEIIYSNLYSKKQHGYAKPYDYAVVSRDFSITNFFRSRWNWTISDRVTLFGGINGDLRSLLVKERRQDFVQDTTIASFYNGLSYGTFSPWINLRYSPIETVTMNLGARYDYYRELTHDGTVFPSLAPDGGGNSGVSGDPSLRFSLTYRISEQHLLKTALGNYNQSPKPHGILSYTTAGASTLPSTKAAHYMIGYELLSDRGFSFDIEGYYNKRWDIASNSEDTAMWDNSGLGRSYGMELLLRRERTERFSGWLSYTLSRSEENLDGTYYVIDDDQTHNIQLVSSFFLPKRWEIGTKLLYTTGNPTTPLDSLVPINGDEMDSEPSSNRYEPYWGEENSDRLSPAVQLSFRVSKKLLSKRTTTEIYFDIQNILYPLYKTPEHEEYNSKTGKVEEYYSPPIPNVGVKVSF